MQSRGRFSSTRGAIVLGGALVRYRFAELEYIIAR